jgi:cytochrome c-type biogenesis protein CcmH/NrfG
VFLVAVFAGLARRARAAAADPAVRGLTVAAGGTFLVWAVHTSVDWLHLIPGLTGIALCSAAVLVGPWRRSAPGRPTPARIAVIAVCSIAVLTGAVLVGRAALADRYLEQARDSLAGDPVTAISKARDSLRLNDERLATYYVEAAAWARVNAYRRARGVLHEAVRREPHDSVPRALLGDLATRRGDHAQALRDYRRAQALDPQNESLLAAIRQARTELGQQ